jgi:hypothetical protein
MAKVLRRVAQAESDVSALVQTSTPPNVMVALAQAAQLAVATSA